jgi:hypothetical protein
MDQDNLGSILVTPPASELFDATKVVRTALEDTTEAMVAEKPKKETISNPCRPVEAWITKSLRRAEGPDDAPGLFLFPTRPRVDG